jgi:hypothetical protein
LRETSDIPSEETEAVFEGETSADEVLDEVSESSIADVVAATADPSEETDLDVSTHGQPEQVEAKINLQHDDGAESTSQTDPALDEVNDLATPAPPQVESLGKSLPFSMAQVHLPQCDVHFADHEVTDTGSQ